MISVLFLTKLHLSNNLSFLRYLNNKFFINRPIKFKYPLQLVEVKHHVLEVVYWTLKYRSMHFCPLAYLPEMLCTNTDGNYSLCHFRNCICCFVFNHVCHWVKNQEIRVSVLTMLWIGQGILAGARYFPLLHSIQTGSGYDPSAYPVGTLGSCVCVFWKGEGDVKGLWH